MRKWSKMPHLPNFWTDLQNGPAPGIISVSGPSFSFEKLGPNVAGIPQLFIGTFDVAKKISWGLSILTT